MEQLDCVRRGDFDHWFRGIRVGCTNIGREKTATHRSRPRAYRTGRCQYRGCIYWRLPCHRRVLTVSCQLRCRGVHTCGRRLYCDWPWGGVAVPDTADLSPSEGHAGCNDHRRRAVACRFFNPQKDLEVLQIGFRSCGGYDGNDAYGGC